MNRIAHVWMALLVSLAVLLPATTFAQGADLEAEAAGLEGDPLGAELEERKPKQQVVVDDPDAKLNEEVEGARAELQKVFNTLQTGETRYAKVDEALSKIISKWISIQDNYIEKHRGLMEQYRAAASKAPAEKRKAAKAIVKLRKKFMKKIKKLRKKLVKVEKLHAKLHEKASKEAPEEPEEAPEE